MENGRSGHPISNPTRVTVTLNLPLLVAPYKPDTPLAVITHVFNWNYIHTANITTALCLVARSACHSCDLPGNYHVILW